MDRKTNLNKKQFSKGGREGGIIDQFDHVDVVWIELVRTKWEKTSAFFFFFCIKERIN